MTSTTNEAAPATQLPRSLHRIEPLTRHKGYVLWLTGLPSSGKSTLGRLLHDVLVAHGYAVEWLDGDEVRRVLTRDLSFSPDDRNENVRRVGYVAHLLQRHGVIVIATLISPYRSARDDARGVIGDANFIEVYVKCDLAECIRRDVKGLYERARRGEVGNVTGLSDPYEAPVQPDVVVETDRVTPRQGVETILAVMVQRRCFVRDGAAAVGGDCADG